MYQRDRGYVGGTARRIADSEMRHDVSPAACLAKPFSRVYQNSYRSPVETPTSGGAVRICPLCHSSRVTPLRFPQSFGQTGSADPIGQANVDARMDVVRRKPWK